MIQNVASIGFIGELNQAKIQVSSKYNQSLGIDSVLVACWQMVQILETPLGNYTTFKLSKLMITMNTNNEIRIYYDSPF